MINKKISWNEAIIGFMNDSIKSIGESVDMNRKWFPKDGWIYYSEGDLTRRCIELDPEAVATWWNGSLKRKAFVPEYTSQQIDLFDNMGVR